MIDSVRRDKGVVLRTTRKPSLAMEAFFKYLLTSFVFVIFSEGQVPCCGWACVLRRSGQLTGIGIDAGRTLGCISVEKIRGNVSKHG